MSSDFRDLLSAFNAHGVEYLVVGAYALAAHGRVRATGDLDVWVKAEPGNAARVMKALTTFGATLHDLTLADLSATGIVFQVGVAPLRIDILTGIDGVTFDEASARIVSRRVCSVRPSRLFPSSTLSATSAPSAGRRILPISSGSRILTSVGSVPVAADQREADAVHRRSARSRALGDHRAACAPSTSATQAVSFFA